MQDKISFYMHAGSGNHGCEAIAASLGRLLMDTGDGVPRLELVSQRAEEDRKYGLDRLYQITQTRDPYRPFVKHAALSAYRKLSHKPEAYEQYQFACIRAEKTPKLAVAIGGDNYCYPEMLPELLRADNVIRNTGARTMLLGCSIEPDSLKDENLVRAFDGFAKITARETLTYEALREAGLSEEKVRLIPDPAFTLPVEKAETISGETVGINLSPMAQRFSGRPEALTDSVCTLITWILKETDYRVLLVPHVVWDVNDDRKVLAAIAARFPGESRISVHADARASALKGAIAQCRFFVGARTHATIAAYSTSVPTLVLGYSVKARGIAKDLFGTEEHYVLPVQELADGRQLIEGFRWLMDHESEIRQHYAAMMPGYIRRAGENGAAVLEQYYGKS